MRADYGVQEFCIIGSQIPKSLRNIPLRYIREDSSDNTVRTSARNLNFVSICVNMKQSAIADLGTRELKNLMEQRLSGEMLSNNLYDWEMSESEFVPYAIAYETSHFGSDSGIVSGKKNRRYLVPLVVKALGTALDANAYLEIQSKFEQERAKTFSKAAKLSNRLLEWNVQNQYEGHSQIIFRLRDQNGNSIKDYDITFKSRPGRGSVKIEQQIEDERANKTHDGTITYYVRTQKFNARTKHFDDLTNDFHPIDIEITGMELHSPEILYVPVRLRLSSRELNRVVRTFQTTIIDVELVRLPSRKVFHISKSK